MREEQTINTRNATSRAAKRGVDTMQIQPRPLRTTARLQKANPNKVISNAWQTTFNTLGQSKTAHGEEGDTNG